MAFAVNKALKGDGEPSPFLIPEDVLSVRFETATGIHHVSLHTTGAITIGEGKSAIVVAADTNILLKIATMIGAQKIHEPPLGTEADLPLNCRSTAKWLMRDDKSFASESGMEHGEFIRLDEAKKKFGYPLGVEWSTGNKREDVTPFHEGVILGAVGDDELVFEKPGYSLPYQFSFLSVIETRNASMNKNRHYLRSFYGKA